MTDKTLEAKLEKLTATGDQMEAVIASMNEKQEVIDDLKAHESKFEGISAVAVLAKEIIEKLTGEIAEEQKKYKELEAQLPDELKIKTPIEF